MGDAPKPLAPGREATPLSILETARALARARTVGTFIDDSLRCLEEAFAGSLVSFNRIDLAGRTAAVAFRPYRGELDQAVDGVERSLSRDATGKLDELARAWSGSDTNYVR